MSQQFNHITNPKVHTSFDRPGRQQLTFTGPGRTKQSFKDECDINIIMARYEQSGVLEHINQNGPRYLDVSAFDYQDAMLTVAAANSLFEELPARLRDKFGNDPAQLLAFVHDPKNLDESVKMGFIDPTKLPPPKESPKPAQNAGEAVATVSPATPGAAAPITPKP